MNFLAILFFFIYILGLGYSFSRFIRQNTFETFIIRLGIGLGALPVVALLICRLGLPLDWRILFYLSLLLPVWDRAMRHIRPTRQALPPHSIEHAP